MSLPRMPTSIVEGIVWPALPGQKGRALLSLLYQLEQTQWWPPDELAAWQFRQLRALVDHARETVPFYRDRLQASGLRSGKRFEAEHWRRLPVLTRADVQGAGPGLLSTQPPAAHGTRSEIFTSGSTGRPIRAVRTEMSLLFWSAFTLRDHLWHRRHLMGKLAAIRHSGEGQDPYPNGTRARFWGSSRRAFDTGPSVSLNINCTVEQQVEWLVRENPHYLLTHPTNVVRLANHCIRKGIRIPNLREVQTLAEILRPDVRDACRQAWDVPVSDMYSGREVGYMALQCPDHEHYHVLSEGALVEVVDEDGEPCAPGRVGRVIVTPLHNFAMPLLRYDVGDYAEVGPACACGRGLPVLARILGREQNMLTLPSGEKRWTLLSSDNIREFLAIAPISQYQFVQKTAKTMEIRLVAERRLRKAEENSIKIWAHEKFGHPFRMQLRYPEDLARQPSGKFQDFVSEVGRKSN